MTYYSFFNEGWMETSTFASSFKIFKDTVKKRPLLLLFDGHMTHISIPAIKTALEENIIIYKFPPHVTDAMQALDLTCFGPLKRAWENRLQRRINEFGIKRSLRRSEFVNVLCAIWGDGMKRKNVISGFEPTVISVRLFH